MKFSNAITLEAPSTLVAVENLVDKIELSNANRFVEDFRQFFDDLSKGIVTPE